MSKRNRRLTADYVHSLIEQLPAAECRRLRSLFITGNATHARQERERRRNELLHRLITVERFPCGTRYGWIALVAEIQRRAPTLARGRRRVNPRTGQVIITIDRANARRSYRRWLREHTSQVEPRVA